jgi:hypothetical protein
MDPLEAEHQTLKKQVDALQREHDELEQKPHSTVEADAHRAKLRVKIDELRAHMARLKSR